MNRVKKAFAVIDKNQDGKVSKEEMGALDMFNKQEVDALFVLGDSNNDGESLIIFILGNSSFDHVLNDFVDCCIIMS